MVLDLQDNKLFKQKDVRETPAGTSSSTSSTSILAPIGSIMPWLKSFTNTPGTLPTGWMEADGSAISDADSVYNGQNAPDLNGGEFMRGFTTSGGTGGSDTMAHTHGVTTNVTVGNHTTLTLSNHAAIAMNNHTSLGMSNHTALNISNESSHTHPLSSNGWAEYMDQGAGETTWRQVAADTWTSTTFAAQPTTGSSASGNNGISLGGDTDSGSAHDHGFSQNISAHSFSQNISAHVIGTNIDAHSFSQNISNHSVTNNAVTSDAASNDENRPKFYNVVWIFRFK